MILHFPKIIFRKQIQYSFTVPIYDHMKTSIIITLGKTQCSPCSEKFQKSSNWGIMGSHFEQKSDLSQREPQILVF